MISLIGSKSGSSGVLRNQRTLGREMLLLLTVLGQILRASVPVVAMWLVARQALKPH